MSRPSGLIASKGIELFTWSTPNGYKVSVLLEELKDAYGLEYTSQAIDIAKNIQKEAWFTAINPNGRIPAIVDHDNNGLAVFEGSTILSYLTRKYDPENKFSFALDDDDYTRAEAWVAWQHAGLGPFQGQANFFALFLDETIPFAIQRYVGETERLYGILDARLKGRDYVVGPGRGKFSIADIALLCAANGLPNLTLSFDQFPNVRAWLARLLARPAVQRGLSVPSRRPWALDEPDEETKAKRAQVKKTIDAAKEQYGYKYASP